MMCRRHLIGWQAGAGWPGGTVSAPAQDRLAPISCHDGPAASPPDLLGSFGRESGEVDMIG
jgi:hypothetical protein